MIASQDHLLKERISFNVSKAVISLPQYTDTQIRKRWSDIALQRFYLKMTHLHIRFAKKVFFLPWYADTHTKWPFFYLCICVFVFVAQIEGPFFLSFWNTSECADTKRMPNNRWILLNYYIRGTFSCPLPLPLPLPLPSLLLKRVHHVDEQNVHFR